MNLTFLGTYPFQVITLANETWVAEGATFNAARQAIIDAGGLIPYTRRLLLERSAHQG